jgi:hypothetical protein
VNDELVNLDGGALTPAQTAILGQRTPDHVIRHRLGPGGKVLSYVEHGWVTATLNEAFGWAWSWEILEWRLVPDDDPLEVFVLGKLTVHASERDLVKTQFGSSDVKRSKSTGLPLSIGDDLKGASSDALKKAASLLGLALDLYRSDNGAGDSNQGEKSTNADAFPSVASAIAWAIDHGAFESKRNAQDAYDELKGECKPETAAQMGRLWRAEVKRRAREGSDT